MKASLSMKLAAGFAAVILLMTVTNIVSIDYITRNRYTDMVRESDLERARALVPVLSDFYRQEGSWASLREEFRMPMQDGPMGMNRRRGGQTMRFMTPLLHILVTEPDGTIVLDTSGTLSGKFRPAARASAGIPVIVSGGTVGRVYTGSMIEPALSGFDSSFLAAVRTAVILSALAVSAVATLISLLLLRHLTSPLARLSKAAAHVAGGNLSIRVPEEGGLEIASLGRQFNGMVASLQESRDLQRRLIADSAHELRTPVTLIQGTLEMILDGIYPLEREKIESLYEETLRLGKLVSELRELSNADADLFTLNREPLDAVRLLRDSLQSFEAVSRKHSLSLEIAVPDHPVPLSADSERLKRVLSNLLSNAMRHTPQGGIIRVSLEIIRGNGDLLISVADTGPGIPEAERERVFERFYRVDSARNREAGGSGLGLAISREIVQAHGGRIWVDPDRTQGARLCFTLPAAAPEGAAGSVS